MGRSRAAVASSQRTVKSICCFTGTFCRLRISRTARSTSWKRAKRASISGSMRWESLAGQGAMRMLSAAGSMRSTPRVGAASPRQLPHLFGEEGDHRVQQAEEGIQRVREHALRLGARRGILESSLDHLQVETAELVPGELVESARAASANWKASSASVTWRVTVARRLSSQRSSRRQLPHRARVRGCSLRGSAARNARRSRACCRNCGRSRNAR